MNVSWSILPFEELPVQDLHAVLKLRVDVFVVEQTCPYAEVDGQDPQAVHVLGKDHKGALIAYARILPPDAHGIPHIGRVVVHPDHRGRDLGRAVMRVCLEELQQRNGSRRSAISAQAHLQGFYASLGYQVTSGTYVWDGIPHVDMALT